MITLTSPPSVISPSPDNSATVELFGVEYEETVPSNHFVKAGYGP